MWLAPTVSTKHGYHGILSLMNPTGIESAIRKSNNLAPAVRMRKHRLEIDRLRAIAILPVLLYHAGLGLHGGFVGVDVVS